jgi:phosphate/sulfate permease
MYSLVVFAGAISAGMAWAIGAQDVAAMATAVGSKALTVKQAIIFGSICEFIGSLMGGSVCETITSGIAHPDSFASPLLYMKLMLAVLCGAFVWLAVATYLEVPVSTTHALIGSLIGLCWHLGRGAALNFYTLGKLAVTWVVSPVMAAALAYVAYSLLARFVLHAANPRAQVARFLPWMYGASFSIFFVTLVHSVATHTWHRHRAEVMMFALLLCVLTSTVLRSSTHLTALASGRATLSQTIAVMAPCDMSSSVRRLIPLSIQQACLACWRSLNSATPASAAAVVADKVEPEVEISAPIAEIVKDHTPAVIELTEANDANTSIAVDEVVMESSSPASDPISELIEVESSFINLLCLSACAVALAHGSNDVSNAVAPFAAILKSYQKHIGALQSQSSALGAGDTPFWVLICGGVGICIGLATYGWRVMATVGEKITKLSHSRGFVAQMSTAFLVLGATVVGLSVSTTQVLVGSITGVALADRDKEKNTDKSTAEVSPPLNAALIKKIALSWFITMPASALCSALIYNFLPY